MLLPVPHVNARWAELARAHMAAGHEASLVDLWEADPSGLFAPDEGVDALAQPVEPCWYDVDPTALAAFTGWALADAGQAHARGVRGGSAYITIDEPRLRAASLERAYLLRETVSHVLVRCDWDDDRRAAISLPRNGMGWQNGMGCGQLAAVMAGSTD